MSSLNVHVLTSVDDVLGIADSWNNLWDRSQTTLPTSRAEFLGLWLKRFAPRQEFRAVVVQDATQLVAALPIVGQRWAKVINAGTVPRNDWLAAGNLLVDENADVSQALRLIAETLNKLSSTIYRFTLIPSHESSWRKFQEALQGAELRIESRPSHEVSLIPISSDWETYQRSWSKNHRKNVARTRRRLEEQGGLQVRRSVPRNIDEAEPLLHKAFQLEDSGWKGEAASSILRTSGMPDFMTRLGELLARRQELEIAFLELNDQPLAFEILFNAKGTLHSYKVGYDERFDKVNPGQILMHELLRDLFETRRCDAYDCIGPVSPATEKWCGERYQMSQWTVAPRRPLSRAVLFAYQHLRRPAKQPLELCDASDPSSGDPGTQPSADEHLMVTR